MSDLSGNEDIAEYRNITNENMYEFVIWANEKRSKTISIDHFNMIIQANIHNWIQENNITWQFALTVVTDTINNQENIDSHFDISLNTVDNTDNVESDVVSEYEYVSEEEDIEELYEKIIKPTSLEERRKLFASAAEKRAKR